MALVLPLAIPARPVVAQPRQRVSGRRCAVAAAALARALHVAPMMKVTHRHLRFLYRLLSKDLILWTEMTKDTSLTYNASDAQALHKLLDKGAASPMVLQLGGSSPGTLAEAVHLARDWGYDEINLNCGCPSEAAVKTRRTAHGFGAQLMQKPELVRQCTDAMADAADVAISVKCRIGTHETLEDMQRDGDQFEQLLRFVDAVADGGKVSRFTIHARSAILSGLKASENRKKPPLRHDFVFRLAQLRPELQLTLNGGICSLEAADAARAQGLDAMIGRWAVRQPWALADAKARVNGRGKILKDYLEYCRQQLQSGQEDHLVILCDAVRNLFAGVESSGEYRRVLTDRLNDRPREGGLERFEAAVAEAIAHLPASCFEGHKVMQQTASLHRDAINKVLLMLPPLLVAGGQRGSLAVGQDAQARQWLKVTPNSSYSLCTLIFFITAVLPSRGLLRKRSSQSLPRTEQGYGRSKQDRDVNEAYLQHAAPTSGDVCRADTINGTNGVRIYLRSPFAMVCSCVLELPSSRNEVDARLEQLCRNECWELRKLDGSWSCLHFQDAFALSDLTIQIHEEESRCIMSLQKNSEDVVSFHRTVATLRGIFTGEEPEEMLEWDGLEEDTALLPEKVHELLLALRTAPCALEAAQCLAALAEKCQVSRPLIAAGMACSKEFQDEDCLGCEVLVITRARTVCLRTCCTCSARAACYSNW
ncbi:unnamed protein product [Effrenium voratum]|nr:unnamed protein product [Effrenium voratum]